MVSAPFWCPLDAGNAPRSGRTCCGSNRKNAAKGGEIARRACCPEWGQTFRKESFQSGEAAKDLILFVRSRYCGELNRGLQNLDSFFEKGFNFVSAKLWFCALIRGLQNLELPARERFYSFRLYEKNGEYPRGLRTSGLRGAIQISARYMAFAEMTGVHHVTGCAGNCKVSGYRR